MKDWMSNIKAGSSLRPKPLWNRSESPTRQLRVPTIVLETREQTGCQSGLLLKIEFKNGGFGWLDAGWFERPNSNYPLST